MINITSAAIDVLLSAISYLCIDMSNHCKPRQDPRPNAQLLFLPLIFLFLKIVDGPFHDFSSSNKQKSAQSISHSQTHNTLMILNTFRFTSLILLGTQILPSGS